MARYTDEEKKKNIVAKMVIRGNVGEKYTPKEKVFSGIPKHERGNLDELLEELYQERMIEWHKSKNCVSIHRRNKERVKEFLDDEVPEYYWDNF